MKTDQYKPGFHKLVHHLNHLKKMQDGEVVSPIHLTVFPTNFCQLNCPYCCFGKTIRTEEELSFEDFKSAVDALVPTGLKALELSGGGDPLLWSHFSSAVEYAVSANLKLSLVTNGIALKKIPQEILAKFAWIRVSVQSAEYAQKIDFDWIPDGVKKSMSYIVYDSKSIMNLKKLHAFALANNIIVRVAPVRPCGEDFALIVEAEVHKYGYPFLYFHKEQGSPKGCYMIWLRAAVDWKGNFLPCPFKELSYETPGYIPDDFAVCHVSEISKWLTKNKPHDLGYRCVFCNGGKDTNDFIYTLLEEVEDNDFV